MKMVKLTLGLREAQMLAFAGRSLMDREGRVTSALSLLHLSPEEITPQRITALADSGQRAHMKLLDGVRDAESVSEAP